MSKENSILIYGASDDLVEVEGAISDEFDCWDKTWKGRLKAPDGAFLVVSALYGSEGWDLNVSAPEGSGFPDWPVSFCPRPDRRDDPAVRIAVPEGTSIEVFGDCA
ncbi:hypothetical protein [Arthrobacter caoxuetaonis]|uniref:Uncharacterized protein n=1 Tax=Arthrobacter caoxuetaonis TaxID=2886935 RepID=A0A9X1MI95_9MICC|nr:hypothetical protein [Arthrobacter caoxuetaonis]MCC3299422.1 hypothetical protein [Arthrobacter caoxuetaonis]USQ59085.1 hypothetical protein NF551_18440 [Arthrobacter caoxuetaonis]